MTGPGFNGTLPLFSAPGGNCSLNAAGTTAMRDPGAWVLKIAFGSATLNSSLAVSVELPAVDPAASYAINDQGQQLTACSGRGDCQAYFQVIFGSMT